MTKKEQQIKPNPMINSLMVLKRFRTEFHFNHMVDNYKSINRKDPTYV